MLFKRDRMSIGTMEAAPVGATPLAGEAKKPFILLVEDYPANIMVATSILDILGVTYEIANNGREAVAKIREKKFDLVLMDVQMPIMDGYAATTTIREHEKGLNHRTPIIGVTAHALKGDRDRCIEAGMDDYISKPFAFEELDAKIKSWTGKKA